MKDLKTVINTINKRIKKESDKIANCRDSLRLLVDEAQELVDDLDNAYEDIDQGLSLLQCAVDKLSEKQ